VLQKSRLGSPLNRGPPPARCIRVRRSATRASARHPPRRLSSSSARRRAALGVVIFRVPRGTSAMTRVLVGRHSKCVFVPS